MVGWIGGMGAWMLYIRSCVHPSMRSSNRSLGRSSHEGWTGEWMQGWMDRFDRCVDRSIVHLPIQPSTVHLSNLNHLWIDSFDITSPLYRSIPTTSCSYIPLIDIFVCHVWIGCTNYFRWVNGWMDGWITWVDGCNHRIAWSCGWMDGCNCLTYPSILAAIHLPALHGRIYQMIDPSCEITRPYASLIWTICGWMD